MLREGAALHWLPFHAQCPPCSPQFKPQSILKYRRIWIFEYEDANHADDDCEDMMVHSTMAALYFLLFSKLNERTNATKKTNIIN